MVERGAGCSGYDDTLSPADHSLRIGKQIVSGRGSVEVVVQKKRNFTYYLAGFVAVITLAVYLAALQNGFIAEWDDGEYVLYNPYIRSINLAF
ncbi:MAG TPA: hypothetical protein VL087_02400, partial [Nitrospirota bacterium]|nr:hypothetical protein [Nitrospirota bacterium]